MGMAKNEISNTKHNFLLTGCNYLFRFFFLALFFPLPLFCSQFCCPLYHGILAGSGLFSFLEGGFVQMFGQIVSSKDTKKYKMKKISLPVNVRRSKTPFA